MSVSLVSTGVQFPDSTIQTTAAGASGLTLISTTTSAGGSGTFDITTGFSSTYDDYIIIGENITLGGRSSDTQYLRVYTNGTLQTGYAYNYVNLFGIGSASTFRSYNTQVATFVDFYDTSVGSFQLTLTNTNSTSGKTQGIALFGCNDGTTLSGVNVSVVTFNNTSTNALTGIRLFWGTGSGTFNSGAVLKLYGVKK